MSKFENKFGKYAINNLTIKLIICYVIGYILRYAPSGVNILNFMTLDVNAILHGQIWRLVSWILVPPSDNNLFLILIMLYFYYSIGTTMERVWGEYKYNVYIFTGLILMIVAAFISYILLHIFAMNGLDINVAEYSSAISIFFGTYYINMSILLAFASTFPDNMVLFMFIIPLKMKWLGIFYGIYLAFDGISALLNQYLFLKFRFFPIAASLLTFAIFWLSSGRFMHLRPKEVKRRNDFKKSVKMTPPGVTKHKCAVCGRTEEDSPDLDFRFCSKCNGNYEYCQDHLFTHVHVK